VTALDLRTESRRLAPRVQPPPGLGDAAIATWRQRMVNEYSSSRVFEALSVQLLAAGGCDDEAEACRGFADEERRHGILCGAVVEAMGGEAVDAMPEPKPFPRHAGVAPLEAALRNVLSICCLSETVAVSLIGAERAEMPEGELHDLLTGIWADEIGHARFGWTMVEREIPRLDDAARDRLGAYLRVAFCHLETHEIAFLPEGPGFGDAGATVGLCSGTAARELFYATVTQVIVPRLESLGLEAERAWRQRWQ
jgi:hypothetical protein